MASLLESVLTKDFYFLNGTNTYVATTTEVRGMKSLCDKYIGYNGPGMNGIQPRQLQVRKPHNKKIKTSFQDGIGPLCREPSESRAETNLTGASL